MPLKKLVKPDDNFRPEVIGINAKGTTIVRPKRDFVPPVPVGTYLVMVFRVTGYDPDCDESAMARVENINFNGESTGWEQDCLGLYEDCVLVVDDPKELLLLIDKSEISS